MEEDDERVNEKKSLANAKSRKSDDGEREKIP